MSIFFLETAGKGLTRAFGRCDHQRRRIPFRRHCPTNLLSITVPMAAPLRRALAFSPKLASRLSSSAARARQPLKSTGRAGKNPRSVAGDGPPRPAEIPFQSKVENSVTLIGRVDMPVMFEAAADGKFWAATVISRHAAGKGTKSSSEGPSLSIPVLFEGDLAHVAALHLKEKDHVCIEGQLIADPPTVINASRARTDVQVVNYSYQVMVHTVNFVEGYSPTKSCHFVPKLEFIDDDNNVRVSDLSGRWSDPEDWQDSEKVAASQPKDVKDVIGPDEFTHLPDVRKPIGKSEATVQKSVVDKDDEHWKNLLDNPTQWKDYRDNKRRDLVKPKHPDFKSKDNKISLWLSTAPKWVFSKLNTTKFDDGVAEPKSANKPTIFEDAWKSLVENPNKWWDNRSKKVKKTSPDFKHKETGEALWLDSSPSWVSSRLPPMRPA